MSGLRILLGDDHELVRRGLSKIIEEQPHWSVVGEAGDGRTAVQQTMALRPDVAILDIGMPLLNGIEAARQIARRAPAVSVLIVSMHADEIHVSEAVRAGARGYLLKDSVSADLIKAIEVVSAGQSFFSPAIARIVLEDYGHRLVGDPNADRFHSLSQREREIFQLVAEGRNTRAIAEILSISPTTVETHRTHVLRKLDIHNTAELVLYAVRRGVVS